MNGGRWSDTRGVSEIYGIVLVVSFALLSALALFSVGWTVVGDLTTDTTDSVTKDTMRTVDSGIADLSETSETVEIEFPEDSGTSVSANPEEGEVNVTVTTNGTFWNRTVAEANGNNRTGVNTTELGTIRQESETQGEVVYQGGGLWQRPDPDGETFVLSEPNLEVTGDSLDLAVVSLSETGGITEGSKIEVHRDPNADTAEKFQQFIEQYYTDRYNPSVTAPIRSNITIESQYADGWATYAEEEMGSDVEAVIYPYDGDENKVRIVLGRLGEEPVDTRDPTYGDDDILYSGTSDLAYLYHNDSTYGDIDEDHTSGPMSPDLEGLGDDEYRLALYNESGRWLIYNNSASQWETAREGVPADPANTAALNVSAGPGDAVDDSADQFFIDPPAWVDETPTTPICVVTNSSDLTTADMRDYLDQNDEDCLENMTGVDEDLVGPIQTPPEFNITMTTTESDLNATYEVDETVEVEVNVSNDGGATGQAPVGVYLINETNWPSNVNENTLTLVNGTAAPDLELDPGENTTREYTFETAHPLVGDNWTVLGVVGGGDNDYVANETSPVAPPPNDAGYFEVIKPDSQLDVVDVDPQPDPVNSGNTQVVNVTINESAEQISDPVTQYLRLTADGRLVNQTEITYSSGENSSELISWVPQDSDDGTVTLNASTYDDSRSNTTEVIGPSVDPSNFEVDIVWTNASTNEGRSINETQTLTVDINVTNTGGTTDTQDIRLENIDDIPVDTTELTLDPGESALTTLEWQTVYGDNGTGPIEVTSEDDSDTEPVTIDPIVQEEEPPLDVIFVMDESGSMTQDACDGCSDSKAEAAVDAATDAVGSLDPSRDRAGVTFFDSGGNPAREGLTNGENITSDFSSTGINDTIRTLSPGGGTRSDEGLDLGTNILETRSDDSREKVMVLLSDGANDGCKHDPDLMSNDDPRDCYTGANDHSLDIVENARNNNNVTTYAVGYGNTTATGSDLEIDVAFLQEVANLGGGEYYAAENDSELSEAFENIFDDITAPETPTFEIDTVNVLNSPVDQGETLDVETTITNTGEEGERVVSLVDQDTSTIVDSEQVSLSNDSSTTVTLEWDTTAVSTGSKSLEVRTVDDTASASAQVNLPASGVNLEITDIDTSPSSPVADQTIDVEIDIENTGSEDANDAPIVLSVNDTATGNTIDSDSTDIDVNAGSTTTTTLTWDSGPGDIGDYDLRVETPDDVNSTSVTLGEQLTDLNVSILDTDPDEIRAGGELDIIVEVNNTDSDTENGTVVLTDERTSPGITRDIEVDVEVSANSKKQLILTWDTRVGQGDDSPIPIRARIANTAKDDDTTVTVREADNLDRASIAAGVDPVNINLEEIEVES